MPSHRLAIGSGLVGALTIVLGIATLIASSADSRIGIAILALGIACLVAVPLIEAYVGEEGQPPQHGQVTFRGTTQPALRYTFSAGDSAHSPFFPLAFMAVGVGILLEGDKSLGVLLTGFFGFATLMTLFGATVGTPPVALTADGIVQDGRMASASIAWEDVQKVFWWDARGTPFLCIDAAGRVQRSQRSLTSFLARLNRRLGAGDLFFPTETLRQDPTVLAELIERCAADPAARRTLTTQA